MACLRSFPQEVAGARGAIQICFCLGWPRVFQYLLGGPSFGTLLQPQRPEAPRMQEHMNQARWSWTPLTGAVMDTVAEDVVGCFQRFLVKGFFGRVFIVWSSMFHGFSGCYMTVYVGWLRLKL